MEKRLGEQDLYYFHNGTHYEIYEKFGAHLTEEDGVRGVHFAVWAPAARGVSVVCNGNGWTAWSDTMTQTAPGIWECFIPGMGEGDSYKYRIQRQDGSLVDKADPYAFRAELRPRTASIVCDIEKFQWGDSDWRRQREKENFLEHPMAVYEVHLGSWKKDSRKNDYDQFMNYRELANDLAEYVRYMGYTHVELMGICEYPLDPSWGYQVTGYYAPTARYGSPEDFQYFVDHLHQEGIGVILDWVPAHFPRDEHGLAEFDGSKLYEYADPLRAEYPEWGTLAFDLGKKEVSNFLIGSALFWVNKYHIDALRVDAVAAMLYNNFSRSQWRPNIYGGELNLESMEFFRHLNSQLRQRTSAFMIAEDSSAIEGVTRDVSEGGLGFGLKWNMGWMNDTLRYMAKDPIYKRYHHDLVTNVLMYAFTERFILPLSHDEVVYGKGSMLNKFPGNMMDKMGGLKTCYTMQIGFPGKKLLFMGQDFAQENEWDVRKSIDWHLADQEWHRDVMNCVRALLALYKRYPVLYDDTGDYTTFEWINYKDAERSIFSYIRRNPWNYNNALVFIHNYTPVQRDGYVAGVPVPGTYKRVFTTYPDGDSLNIKAKKKEADGREYRLEFDLRPLESVILEIPAAPAKKPRKRTAKASAAAKTTKTTKTAKDAQSPKADASKSAKARRP